MLSPNSDGVDRAHEYTEMLKSGGQVTAQQVSGVTIKVDLRRMKVGTPIKDSKAYSKAQSA